MNDHPRNNIRTKPRQGCGECNSPWLRMDDRDLGLPGERLTPIKSKNNKKAQEKCQLLCDRGIRHVLMRLHDPHVEVFDSGSIQIRNE